MQFCFGARLAFLNKTILMKFIGHYCPYGPQEVQVFQMVAHLYAKLQHQHGLLLLMVEVSGFLLYWLFLLSIPCQYQFLFKFCQALQIFHCCLYKTYMCILLSVISFHCNIFVKLSVFYIYTLQTVRKVSVSYLYSLILTMAATQISKVTKREIIHIEY